MPSVRGEDEELVSLRLNFDVPDEMSTSVTEMNNLTEQLRTNSEAYARFTLSTADYYDRIVSLAREALTIESELSQNAERRAEAEERIATARSRGASASEPVAPDLSANGGIPDPTRPGSPTRSTPTDAQNAPAASASAATPDPNAPTATPDPNAPAVGSPSTASAPANVPLGERLRNLAGGVNTDVQNASRLGVLGNATDLVGRAGTFLGGGGAATGALGVAARAVPYVGAAYLAMQAGQAVNDQYQQNRQIGMTVGGGASEGTGYRMAMQGLAMNPMISTEQSRQIVMGALNEGYTGKEFDTVTSFMAENLKDMNMSVADSMKLVKNNVEAGGQSFEALNLQLATLKDTALGSNTSAANMQSQFMQLSEQGIAQGMSGSSAGEFGTIGANLFMPGPNGETNILAGKGAEIFGTLAGNDQVLGSIAGSRGKGENYYELPSRLSESGEFETEIESFIRKQAQSAGGDPWRFQKIMEMYGVKLNLPQAKALLEQTTSGSIVSSAKESIAEVSEVKDRTLYEQSMGDGIDGFAKDAVNEVKNIGTWFGGLGKTVGSVFTDQDFSTDWDGFQEQVEKSDFQKELNVKLRGAGVGKRSKAIDNLAMEYGLGNVYLDENGEKTSLRDLDFKDDSTFDRILGGKISNGKDGKSMDFQDFMNTGGSDSQGVYSGQQQIGLTPEASKVFQFVTGSNPTQNMLQSYSGTSGATINDAPVGDR